MRQLFPKIMIAYRWKPESVNQIVAICKCIRFHGEQVCYFARKQVTLARQVLQLIYMYTHAGERAWRLARR